MTTRFTSNVYDSGQTKQLHCLKNWCLMRFKRVVELAFLVGVKRIVSDTEHKVEYHSGDPSSRRKKV